MRVQLNAQARQAVAQHVAQLQVELIKRKAPDHRVAHLQSLITNQDERRIVLANRIKTLGLQGAELEAKVLERQRYWQSVQTSIDAAYIELTATQRAVQESSVNTDGGPNDGKPFVIRGRPQIQFLRPRSAILFSNAALSLDSELSWRHRSNDCCCRRVQVSKDEPSTE